MSIIRTQNPTKYTVIPNGIFDDNNIDWKDMGLLVYLLSKPDGWQVSVAHLATQRKAGRDAIFAILKALKNAGYVVMKRKPLGGVDYLVFDAPQTQENPLTDSPDVVATSGKSHFGIIPLRENPLTDNPTLVNTETTITTEKQLVTTEARARKNTDFKKPTAEQAQKYATEKQFSFTGQEFIDSNDAKGWVIGRARTPMKDWKAAMRTWQTMRNKDQGAHNGQSIRHSEKLTGAAKQSADFHEGVKNYAKTGSAQRAVTQ